MEPARNQPPGATTESRWAGSRLLFLVGTGLVLAILPCVRGEDRDEAAAQLLKHTAFDNLNAVRVLREDLQQRRLAVLRVIFNDSVPWEDLGSTRYPLRLLTLELTQRVSRLREIWDNPTTAAVPMSQDLAAILAMLDAGPPSVAAQSESDLEMAVLWRRLLASEGLVDVRDYFTTPAEYTVLAYSRRVREANATLPKGTVAPWVRELTTLVNDYRQMVGYAANVRWPWSDSFDEESVGRALDSAVIEEVFPLRALRISPALCRAAQAECEQHLSAGTPSAPAAGAPLNPDERARRHGYEGGRVRGESYELEGSAADLFATLCARGGRLWGVLCLGLDFGAARCGDRWVLYFGGLHWP